MELEEYKILGGITTLREFNVRMLSRFANVSEGVVSSFLDSSKQIYEIVATDNLAHTNGDNATTYRLKKECFPYVCEKLALCYEQIRRQAAKNMPTFTPVCPSGLKRTKVAIMRLRSATTAADRTQAFRDAAQYLASSVIDIEEAEANGAMPSMLLLFRNAVDNVEDALEKIAIIVNSERLSEVNSDPRLVAFLEAAECALEKLPISQPRLDDLSIGDFWQVPGDSIGLPTITKPGEWLLGKFSSYSKRLSASVALLRERVEESKLRERFSTRPFPVRSETNLRTMPLEDVSFHGEDESLDNLVRLIGEGESKVIFVHGSPGIGKTTLTLEAAKRATRGHESIYSPSDICIFDCAGLSTFDELSSLFVGYTQDASSGSIPEHLEDRSRILEARLAAHSDLRQRRLWVLDGFDDVVGSIPNRSGPVGGGQLLSRCLNASNELRIVVTLRDLPSEEFRTRVFGTDWTTEHISHPSGFPEHFREAPPFAAHPTAAIIIGAANRRFGKIGERPTIVGQPNEEDSLYYACSYSWGLLNNPQREMLACLCHMPGGVWTSDEPSLSIDWRKAFKNEEWMTTLSQLHELAWVVSRPDRHSSNGRSYVYKMRPALLPFVESRVDRFLSKEISRRLIWFWARCLKLWSSIIAARMTDRVAPRADGSPEMVEVITDEESARYLFDLTRLNWAHSYKCIVNLEVPGNIHLLLTSYLRGCICYCRMTGAHLFFKDLVAQALTVLSAQDVRQKKRSEWGQAFHAVCIASCYGMKGRTHRRLGEWGEANSCLLRAVEILRSASESFVRVRRELAWALTELGRVHHYTGEWDRAEKELATAAAYRGVLITEMGRREIGALGPNRTLCSRHLRVDERQLASTLNIHGNLLNDRLRWSEASKLHSIALDIRKSLDEKYPFYFKRYVAHCYNDLGNSLFHLRQFDSALILYAKALEIREELVPNDETPLAQYVARTCNNIGNTFRKQGNWGEAQRHLERALRIYKTGVNEMPDKFNNLIAQTLFNLGRVHYHQGHLADALKLLQDADRHHALAADGRTVRFDWIETCNFLALAYLEFDASDSSLAALMKAESLLKSTNSLCHKNYLFFRAFTLNTTARVLIHRNPNALRDAEQLLNESIRLRNELSLLLDDRAVLDIHFAQAWHDLGKLLKYVRPTEAKGYLERALEIRVKLTETVPLYASRLVARSSLELGDIARARSDFEQAVHFYTTAAGIFYELNRQNPNGFRREFEHATASLSAIGK